MSTAAIETVTRMLEGLPQSIQDRAIEHMREYLDEITDDIRWEESFARSSAKLAAFARNVRQEFKDGKTEPFDLERL